VLNHLSFRFLRGVLPFLSPHTDFITFNTWTGREVHERRGYRSNHWIYLPNGFDSQLFKPLSDKRTILRAQLGIKNGEIALGAVSRFDPMKNVPLLFGAVKRLSEEFPIKLVFAGRGIDKENSQLRALISEHQLNDHILLLGEVEKPQELYPALDIFCLTSFSEGFPNVLGEAMACGVPCIATAVGDIPSLMGDTGLLVESDNIEKFTQGLRSLLKKSSAERKEMGERGLQRIQSEFEVRSIVRNYEQCYQAVVAGKVE